jgi:hypothetical protein
MPSDSQRLRNRATSMSTSVTSSSSSTESGNSQDLVSQHSSIHWDGRTGHV